MLAKPLSCQARITLVMAAMAVAVAICGGLALDAVTRIGNLLARTGTAAPTTLSSALDIAQYARRLMWGLVFAGLTGIAIAFAILRAGVAEFLQLADEGNQKSAELERSTASLVALAQTLARGASENASALERSAASAAEITAITRSNTDNARAVAGLMSQTGELVAGANRNLEEMVRSMEEIDTSSSKISRIIKVIDEIAFQTNILALNAAVEAARAGEAGLGFAVVAEEVRNLAQRSAQAARDTAALIEESIAKSSQGSQKLQQVAASIDQITGSAGQVKTLLDEVDAGSREEARGIEQIVTAVGSMEQATQESAAEAGRGARETEAMAAQVRNLRRVLHQMRNLLSGGTGRGNALVEGEHATSAPAAIPAGPARELNWKARDIRRPSAAGTGFPLNEREQTL